MGNNGHGFYANNPDVNVNQPTVVGFATGGPQRTTGGPTSTSYGWTQDISFFGNDAPSYYDAFQAKLDKRFTTVCSSSPTTPGRRT